MKKAGSPAFLHIIPFAFNKVSRTIKVFARLLGKAVSSTDSGEN